MRPRRPLTILPLVAATYFMVAGGPYGLEELVQKTGFLRAIIILLITPIVWSLPTALMIGELSSAIPAEGGYYVWVRRAAGPFWGFQEAWLSLAASVFDMAIYPTLFVAYVSRLFPGSDAGWHGIAIGAAVIAVCVIWNLAGGKAVGDGSLVMLFIMLGPFVVLTVFALLHWKSGGGTTPAPAEPFGFVAGLLVCMWNYMGFDNASNVGGEVENPQRVYPLAMIVTLDIVLWGASMVLEFLALVLLRFREPELKRPFRIPGGVIVCSLLGVAPTVLVIVAGVHSRSETIAGMNALWFSLLIMIAGV